ncbi:Transcriptional regulatory protein LiaR [Hyella patelloides LEGE 07179]|uniref:Transcriptional regulatory protein LiaR n=1 Tax=Hyella patelloides LEGE 07179 TaxID=945734 RepID=A0A563VRQ9_9CYAN|nr:response regulator transcription factor [Hyella patelloides]VEP13967.1 Transcriptional regulatory protein LiaR [Hyella patelloides LEGE 07179]
MISLLLVDDQEIFRQGLATLLATEEDLEVIGQASNGREAIALTEQLQPDVILMDVRMPICDGVSATREIHQRYPWMRILILTTFEDDEYVWQSLQAGAMGYILKRKSSEQMAIAIRAVAQGYSQLSSAIAPKVFANLKSAHPTSTDALNQLSSRELEVLRLIGQGKNNQEIAQTLHLSIGTVKNYVTQILSKLSLRDRVAAALLAQHLPV